MALNSNIAAFGSPGTPLIRLYAFVVAVIGLVDIVYNLLWLAGPAAPFQFPKWVTIFELAWTLPSFALVLRPKTPPRGVMLATSYILYATLAVGYSYWLGSRHGMVTEEMVPLWWKLLDLVAGTGFLAGGLAVHFGKRDRHKEEDAG